MVSKKAKVARPTSVKKPKSSKSATVAAKKSALKVSGKVTRQQAHTLASGQRRQAKRDAKR
jgi:hypothetical protein